MSFKIKYGSTFTGSGNFENALEEVFGKKNTECAFWSEIDPYACTVYEEAYPENASKNWGDIERLVFDKLGKKFVVNENRVRSLPDINFLFGGSSCQDLSIQTANRKGVKGEKSRVFFAFCHILRIKKPKFFLLENVASMSKKDLTIMEKNLSAAYGSPVKHVMINSTLVSAQKRKRYYFCNWPLVQPKDKGITMDNIVAWSKSTRYKDKNTGKVYSNPGPDRISYKEEREVRNGKANTLVCGEGCKGQSTCNYIEDSEGNKRLLTPEECEMLQGMPKGLTKSVPKSQRYKICGNAVQRETVVHIFKCLRSLLVKKQRKSREVKR